MIKVTINNKKVSLPTIEELTVSQYIKFVKTDMNLISYLSVCLNKTYKEAFDMKLKNIPLLNKRIGKLKDYTKAPVPKHIIVNDKLHLIKDIDISTVGQRFMIEENGRKLKDEELFCFILAIGIVEDKMNVDEINKLKRKLMKQPYLNILPVGFFLAKRFLIGKKSGMSYFNRFVAWISLKVNGNRLVLTS